MPTPTNRCGDHQVLTKRKPREPSIKPDQFYTLRDAANALKEADAKAPHSPTGLRNWCDQGRIKHDKLSSGERVMLGAALLRLIDGDDTP